MCNKLMYTTNINGDLIPNSLYILAKCTIT